MALMRGDAERAAAQPEEMVIRLRLSSQGGSFCCCRPISRRQTEQARGRADRRISALLEPQWRARRDGSRTQRRGCRSAVTGCCTDGRVDWQPAQLHPNISAQYFLIVAALTYGAAASGAGACISPRQARTRWRRFFVRRADSPRGRVSSTGWSRGSPGWSWEETPRAACVSRRADAVRCPAAPAFALLEGRGL